MPESVSKGTWRVELEAGERQEGLYFCKWVLDLKQECTIGTSVILTGERDRKAVDRSRVRGSRTVVTVHCLS